MKINLKREVIIWVALIVPILYLLIMWDKVPDKLPTHINMQGQIDGFGPKYFHVLISVGLYILMLILPLIDPRRKNYTIFEDTYFKLRFILVLLYGMISLLFTINSMYHNFKIDMLMPLFIFMLITVIGNYLGNIRQNYFVGIKVPWTLNNEENWNKTHRMAGKLWVAGGLACIVSLLIFKNYGYINLVILVIMVLAPIVYSYLLHVRMNEGAK
jgi:uncharacterized membrane protein